MTALLLPPLSVLARLCISLVATCLWLPAQAIPAIEHWQLPSGAQVYLMRSPGIPMLDVQIDFDAGSRREPIDQPGVASATATMLSKGVLARSDAPALDENALGEAWADLGARFGARAGVDRFSLSLRTLTEPALLRRALALASRQIGRASCRERVSLNV